MDKAPFAFVLMPFDDAFTDIYQLGIKAAAKEAGCVCERVDEQIFHKENILQRIYNQIEAADFIIADMTGKNANVFYEVGYAHAKNKTCILLTSKADDIPFDMKHQRHIIYNNSISELKSQLFTEIMHVKTSIAPQKRPITVTLSSSYGYLEKDQFGATGHVTFVFDFNNDSDQASPDIDTMYLYTGKGWRVYQEKKICTSGASDNPFFDVRHIVKPPIGRLQKSVWTQMQLKCTKLLANKYRGEEIKDAYDLKGSIQLRVICHGAEYKFDFNVDISCEEMPF